MRAARRRRCRNSGSISGLITSRYEVTSVKDRAVSHTYVRVSTIKGAGNGLFASCIFDGNYEESAYLGEYNEGGSLSLEKLFKGDRFNDYVLIYKEVIRDA